VLLGDGHRLSRLGLEQHRSALLAQFQGAAGLEHAPPRGEEEARAELADQQQQQHNAGMATSITIRGVPDETRDELASRAAISGRSLQEYLRAKLVELARQPDVETLLERIRARKSATASSLSAEQILSHRDADRR
jgi:antitoxin FitA